MKTVQSLALATLLLFGSLAALAAAPRTLVTRQADGTFAPAAAKSWTVGKDSVTFVLADGVDGAAAQKLLSERLAAAKVTFAAGKLTVAGVPTPALLEQLSTLSLTGDGADPLADLAGLGTVVAMETPEGGGSIRASKPTATARPRIIKDHEPTERVTAQVVEVRRRGFPAVSLKLKLKNPPTSGPLKERLKRGKLIDAEVVMSGDAGAVDFNAATSQRNLAAYYLVAGDQVTVHAVPAEGEAIEIDWVERSAAATR